MSEPGALDLPTEGTIAASACISPSILRSGRFSFASFVASLILSTSSLFALPYVEYESIAIFGSAPTRFSNDFADDIAISESSSAFGLTLRAASANKNVPFSPSSQSGTTSMKNADTSFVFGAVFKI